MRYISMQWRGGRPVSPCSKQRNRHNRFPQLAEHSSARKIVTALMTSREPQKLMGYIARQGRFPAFSCYIHGAACNVVAARLRAADT